MPYWALLAMIHWSPAMTTDTSVEPSVAATFTETRFALLATPVHFAARGRPLPAMMPAMCVPWP